MESIAEFIEVCVIPDQDLGKLYGCEYSVSSRMRLQEDDMARRLATQVGATFLHLLQNISVTHRGPQELNAMLIQSPLQRIVGHDCAYNPVLLQSVVTLEMESQSEQYVVSVKHAASGRNKQRAVSVSVKGDA